MAEYYYSTEPTSRHRRHQFTTVLRGREFTFQTDAGVFSRAHLDPGSKILINRLELASCKAPLDLGCGYGAIGLVIAAELQETIVYMNDPNRRAVELARINRDLNGIKNVRIEEGEDFTPWPQKSFDLIVTNPPLRAGKETVLRLFHQAAERLTPGGALWVVIRTSQGAKSYAQALARIIGSVETKEIKSGYRVFKATKMSPASTEI
ncbi:MAG TPA: methyltransferase [Bacillota bacterium]